MMKKILSVLLLVAMVFVMASCGGAKKGIPNFDVPEGGYDGSEVTITFYHTMGSNLTEVLDRYIESFNKLYPNIHINHSQVGSYDDVRDQISTEITVSNQPNIAYCYPDHVALYNLAGAVATLDNLIDSKITVTRADGTTETLGLTEAQKDDFIEGYYNEGTQFGDGLMYTMPFSKSTEVLYYNKTSNMSDYILGNRQLGAWIISLSAEASDMSGWMLMGLPGYAYVAGFNAGWIGLGLAIGTLLNWQFVASRLRNYTELANNSLTLPDFFQNRFQDNSNFLRVIPAIFILIFFVIYTSSGFVAGGKLFETIFHLPYEYSLFLGAFVVVFYTFVGGFTAVCTTDFILSLIHI